MKSDNLLDMIIPLDLGLKGKNEALRHGVKMMMAVLVVMAIVVSAIEVTLNVCPEGAAGWYVWVMVAWHVFLHAVIYCCIAGVVLALKGLPKEESARPAPKVNTFFSMSVDEAALVEYIKSNPDQFTSGEDMAILYLIMSENHYIASNKTQFHAFLSSLIACKGCRQLTNGCMKVKETLAFHNLDEKKILMAAKYEKMEELLQRFIEP